MMRAKTTTRPAHRLSRRRKGEETSESQLQRVRVRRGAGGVRVAARCPIYGRCRARRGGVWGAGEAGGVCPVCWPMWPSAACVVT